MASLGAAGAPAAAQGLRVFHLTCEYQAQPLGVQTTAPALSWQLGADQRQVRQTTYRILVSDDKQALSQHLGRVWDSGKVAADTSLQVVYAGQPLQAGHTYYWQVQAWDNHSHASTWSAPAAWQMGLLTSADWHGAHWIAYEQLPAARVSVLPVDGAKDTYTGNNVLPLLRKPFVARKQVR
ncbi:MAG: alpha-L-rhamnosidase, partial [Hymenobacter sp.]